ncbi:MAG: hypothetical protein OEO82_02875 [Gammaproteobacteria bacterium]|nr:hypothetical protein [Gammaproteobacteria bacterium]
MASSIRLALLLPVAAAGLMLAAPAWCGDDDKAPAYMIYIDPETGKYTTQDPDAENAPTEAMVVAPSSSQEPRGSTALLIAGTAILVVMLAASVIKYQRKQLL